MQISSVLGVVLVAPCLLAAGCGSVSSADGVDAAASADAAIDAPPADALHAPLTLEPGFPLVGNLDINTGSMIAVSGLSTPSPDHLLVAVLVWGTTSVDQEPLTVTGANLTWTRQVDTTFLPQSGVAPGTSGDAIWTAWAADPIASAQLVTATRGSTTEAAAMTFAVYSFAHAAPALGATGTHTDQATTTPMTVDIAVTTPGSWIVGGFHHGTANAIRMPNADTVYDITDDPTNAVNGHFNAIGRYRGVTITPGTIELGSATSGKFSLSSAVEIVPR